MSENNITNYQQFFKAQDEVKTLLAEIKVLEARIAEIEVERHKLYTSVNEIQEAQDKFLWDMYYKTHK